MDQGFAFLVFTSKNFCPVSTPSKSEKRVVSLKYMPQNSFFKVCVKANTNVQFVVNIFITINIFQHKYVYSESILNS